jgi:hypothetical protein
MQSVITLTVEHGETTDDIDDFFNAIDNGSFQNWIGLEAIDYTVEVDI